MMYVQCEGLITFLYYTKKSAYKCSKAFVEILAYSILILKLNIMARSTTRELQNSNRKAACQGNKGGWEDLGQLVQPPAQGRADFPAR